MAQLSEKQWLRVALTGQFGEASRVQAMQVMQRKGYTPEMLAEGAELVAEGAELAREVGRRRPEVSREVVRLSPEEAEARRAAGFAAENRRQRSGFDPRVQSAAALAGLSSREAAEDVAAAEALALADGGQGANASDLGRDWRVMPDGSVRLARILAPENKMDSINAVGYLGTAAAARQRVQLNQAIAASDDPEQIRQLARSVGVEVAGREPETIRRAARLALELQVPLERALPVAVGQQRLELAEQILTEQGILSDPVGAKVAQRQVLVPARRQLEDLIRQAVLPGLEGRTEVARASFGTSGPVFGEVQGETPEQFQLREAAFFDSKPWLDPNDPGNLATKVGLRQTEGDELRYLQDQSPRDKVLGKGSRGAALEPYYVPVLLAPAEEPVQERYQTSDGRTAYRNQRDPQLQREVDALKASAARWGANTPAGVRQRMAELGADSWNEIRALPQQLAAIDSELAALPADTSDPATLELRNALIGQRRAGEARLEKLRADKQMWVQPKSLISERLGRGYAEELKALREKAQRLSTVAYGSEEAALARQAYLQKAAQPEFEVGRDGKIKPEYITDPRQTTVVMVNPAAPLPESYGFFTNRPLREAESAQGKNSQGGYGLTNTIQEESPELSRLGEVHGLREFAPGVIGADGDRRPMTLAEAVRDLQLNYRTPIFEAVLEGPNANTIVDDSDPNRVRYFAAEADGRPGQELFAFGKREAVLNKEGNLIRPMRVGQNKEISDEGLYKIDQLVARFAAEQAGLGATASMENYSPAGRWTALALGGQRVDPYANERQAQLLELAVPAEAYGVIKDPRGSQTWPLINAITRGGTIAGDRPAALGPESPQVARLTTDEYLPNLRTQAHLKRIAALTGAAPINTEPTLVAGVDPVRDTLAQVNFLRKKAGKGAIPAVSEGGDGVVRDSRTPVAPVANRLGLRSAASDESPVQMAPLSPDMRAALPTEVLQSISRGLAAPADSQEHVLAKNFLQQYKLRTAQFGAEVPGQAELDVQAGVAALPDPDSTRQALLLPPGHPNRQRILATAAELGRRQREASLPTELPPPPDPRPQLPQYVIPRGEDLPAAEIVQPLPAQPGGEFFSYDSLKRLADERGESVGTVMRGIVRNIGGRMRGV